MTIAVTGSTGFIGNHLMKMLDKGQHRIIEISRSKDLDITKWEDVKGLPSFDVIVHLAAKSFVPDSFDHPWDFYNVNQISTLNVLELARKHQAKVIFLSSYLYGAPQNLPVSEDHPLNPHNPYAQTKLLCEKMCEGYNRDFKVPVTIFRPFNIYGPGQNEPFLIPTILEQAKKGSIHLKDPRPKRDYIHVTDIIRAIIKAFNSSEKDCGIYNLGSGTSHSVEEIVAMVEQFIEKSLEISYAHEYREGEVLNTIADISRATKVLDWKPEVSLEEGLKDLCWG